ncbi:MAG: capsular polysaccharide export protein, LipB/KpsS family [Microthrixaceae bacterium]
MRWFVRRFLPGALRRPELAQARAVMADAPNQPSTGPRVLFITFRAWTTHVAWETTIAQALRLRGARCEFFFCGGGLPICEIGWPAEEAAKPCKFCGPYVAGMIDAASFPRRSLGELVDDDERRAIETEVRTSRAETVSFRGRALDPLVRQSLMWFFRSGTLPDTDEVRRARDDFRVGAAIMATAAPRLLETVAPDVVVLVNGLFYEDRIIREEAIARGVRVVAYEVGAQAGTLFFSDAAPAADLDISDLWQERGDCALGGDEELMLESVLQARRSGSGMPRRFYSRRRGLGTRSGAPVVAVFTNVSWDTAMTGEALAFGSMLDWVAETLRIADNHPEIEFVIRAHPAESRWPGLESRDRLADSIHHIFPSLPRNVRLVPSEERLDSYALIDAADVVAVFSSTVGLEAAAAGKAVCIAGKSHYRGRGFTNDVTSAEDYRALFADLSWAKPDLERRERARRYAYLFFCRTLIPFPAVVEDEPAEPIFTFTSVADLGSGNDPYLDLVCDGILGRGPLRLPATGIGITQGAQ